MRDLILWDMVSLDGHFEAPEGDLDWFAVDDELERYILDSQSAVGTVLFGRRTYLGMKGYWETAEGTIAEFMNAVPKVVFSTTLEQADWHNTRLVRQDAPAEVERLKAEAGDPIFAFGSADFSATLIRHDLVDEYRIGINPVLLGAGTPLFKGGHDRRPLRLVECNQLKSGLVILHYRRPGTQAS